MLQVENYIETDKFNAHSSQISFENFIQNDISAILRVV
ncbi:Unknown protein sequence [Pseudomonas syringae pv. cilantro]|uniref:Uncharacterized protein n=1 Tax=Pseudomonas syringae pv. cilantro TaxID=81035 RepID=A0A0N0X9P0_PSESX|nr:Unknown protein sequence [Pseudomonas syringae pv. cilantro]